jgi:propanol-preferring alcohol dehydrogenase
LKVLQYRSFGSAPEVVEIDTPVPDPGQLRLKITAAGVCHSDAFLMTLPAEAFKFGLPLTLGHEGVGIIDMVGKGVDERHLGVEVAVYGAWGCGQCYACAQGHENYCERAAAEGIVPPGLGAPGSMAEYMIIDDLRHVVPLGGLDAVKTVSLTDAGLTPYHAIKGSLAKLVPGSTAVVIGVGGLGHVAVQLLRALSPATVIALDLDDAKLALATEVGAHHTMRSDIAAVEAIKTLTNGLGATAVFDFVAAQATMDLAKAVVRVEGDAVLVGLGAGVLPVGLLAGAFDSSIRAPYWGTRSELFEVLELARRGLVHVETEVFSLDAAPTAYERLLEGSLRGRAVIVP